MLQNFCYDLSLRRAILFSHSTIHQFYYISVEMRYEMLKILAMGFWIETLSSNPFYRVSLQKERIK